jgi:hypothetical protein
MGPTWPVRMQRLRVTRKTDKQVILLQPLCFHTHHKPAMYGTFIVHRSSATSKLTNRNLFTRAIRPIEVLSWPVSMVLRRIAIGEGPRVITNITACASTYNNAPGRHSNTRAYAFGYTSCLIRRDESGSNGWHVPSSSEGHDVRLRSCSTLLDSWGLQGGIMGTGIGKLDVGK